MVTEFIPKLRTLIIKMDFVYLEDFSEKIKLTKIIIMHGFNWFARLMNILIKNNIFTWQ